MLQAPHDDIQAIIEERFPKSRLVICIKDEIVEHIQRRPQWESLQLCFWFTGLYLRAENQVQPILFHPFCYLSVTVKKYSNTGQGEIFESESQVLGLVDSRGNSEDEYVASIDTHNTHPIMDDVAECEIRLEYLQTGKQIGLGSYGEVHHVD